MSAHHSIGVVAALVAITVSQAASSAASASDEFSAAEQAALAGIVEKGMAEQRQPGLNVGIWIPGRGTWTASFGQADIDARDPMDLADHVRIASITKTFVATAILQLADQGKLSLDDKLSTYVDGIPNGESITVRHLLGMTSGIYDFTMDEQFGKDFAADPLMPFGPDDAVAIVQRHEPEFMPGEKVSYCDTNYVLLGVILEKVTGRPVGQVIEQILVPLELRETSFPTTPAIPAPFARGYYAGDDGKGAFLDYTATNPDVAWTAGAMISTLDDLRIWAKALATGVLLEPETQAERLQFAPIAAAPGLSVGYGLGIASFGDFIGHNGAIFGYSTAMFYLPEADATFVLEGNQASNFSNATTDIFLALAKHLFPERFGSVR